MRFLTLVTLVACGAGEPDKDSGASTTTTWTPTTDLTDVSLLRLETTMGVMMLDMYEEDAPITVANFLRYVDEGFYDGSDGSEPTVFHRVIADFMIQGGG